MLKLKLYKWVIMNKERTLIAKGVPKDRHLIDVNDKEDTKRILTYSTKGRATAGYKGPGFYAPDGYRFREDREKKLEAVYVKITIEERSDNLKIE